MRQCVGSRVMSVIAHADDDLYFINPAIDQAIARGACVHTVVVTSGYVGSPDNQAREQGLKAAYAFMLGEEKLTWRQQWLDVHGKKVEHWLADSSPRVELSFLHLPAGAHDDLRPRKPATLYQLFALDEVSETVGEQAGQSYREQDLIQVLRALLAQYDPDIVMTLQPFRAYPVRHSRPAGEGDHPDHVIVAKLTMMALIELPRVREIRQHDDYPIQDFPANLSAEQADRKTAIVRAYCLIDARGCAGADLLKPDCDRVNDSHWGAAWLCRHYPAVMHRPAVSR